MGYLRDYSFDIFVSCASGQGRQARYGNHQLNLLSDWTRRLVDDLTAQIDDNLGRYGDASGINVFFDPNLEDSDSLTESLKQTIEQSALIFVAMSPLYLKSSRCTEEIKWFSSARSEDSPELRRFNRIFVARIIPTDHTTWPEGLKDELGRPIWGHFFHPRVGRPQTVVPFGWPSPSMEATDYWPELLRSANEITTKLLRLKALEDAAAEKTEEGGEPLGGRRVLPDNARDSLVASPAKVEDVKAKPAKIFICYRRGDSAGQAGRVHDQLERHFGSENLFMDVDSIPLGVNFAEYMCDQVSKVDILLAVIGPSWLDARDENGKRRLNDADDYVRTEIATAFQCNIPVIPVFVSGVNSLKAHDLPTGLRKLALLNGIEVRHVSFKKDVDTLIKKLGDTLRT
jgi:hypothetical protein